MLYNLIIDIKKTYKAKNLLPIIGLIGYIIISSTNENAFTSNYTVFLAIALAIVVKGYKESRNET